MSKEIVVRVYNKLAIDPVLLSLMGLTLSATPLEDEEKEISRRICKTRQVGDVADGKPRLAIWIHDPKPFNPYISQNTLEIDILVSLVAQRSTGIAFDLGNRIKELVKVLRLGTGIKNIKIDNDLVTAPGWFKSAVTITYNSITKY